MYRALERSRRSDSIRKGTTVSHAQPPGPVEHGAAPGSDDDPRWKLTPTKMVVTVILLAAIVVPLLVSTYDTVEPRLFGFPFFYWYQLAWVFLAALCCSIAFYLLKRESDAFARSHPDHTGKTGSHRAGGEH